jgi:hypothetical protein
MRLPLTRLAVPLAVWAITLALPIPSLAEPIVLSDGAGGPLAHAYFRWRYVANRGDTVEVRVPCASACTLVLVHIPRDRLCIGKDGAFGFHQTRTKLSPEGEEPIVWQASPYWTKWLYEKYPEGIRNWLEARGGIEGLPYEGYHKLWAPELWKMGYRKCQD